MKNKNVLQLVGSTPLLKLEKITSELDGEVYVKLESKNPGGSLKDRIALNMIEEAEQAGDLRPGMSILEPTSGNTGIGLALVAAAKNYDVILTMPETMSVERRDLLKAYGAELELTPGEQGMQGAIDRARQICAERGNVFMPNQFENPSNPEAHYQNTGPEIFDVLGSEIDAFIMGVGTGGTITGVGQFLREHIPDIDLVAVEPDCSPVLSGGKPGLHGIQGIGAGFVPPILETEILDQVIAVGENEALEWQARLGREEGLLVGISAGAHLQAVAEYLAINPGRTVVTVLCDTGERYLAK